MAEFNERPAASDEAFHQCMRKAQDLLARRAHFRHELTAKLTGRGFSGELAATVCDRLAARGLLDDRDNAKNFALQRLERKGYGPLRLRSLLLGKGVDREIIDTVLGELLTADRERGALERLIRTWSDRHTWDDAKLARHLAGKGYSSGAVRSAIESTRRRVQEIQD